MRRCACQRAASASRHCFSKLIPRRPASQPNQTTQTQTLIMAVVYTSFAVAGTRSSRVVFMVQILWAIRLCTVNLWQLQMHLQATSHLRAACGWIALVCPGRRHSSCVLSVARLRKVRRESLKRSTLCCFMLAINNRTDGTTPPCSSLSRWMTVFSLAKEAYSMAKTAGYAMTIATVPTKPYRSGHHSQLVRSQGRQES